MIPKSICAASLSAFIAPAAYAVTVSVPVKSQPESITVAANGDLMLGSAGSTKIYRAKKGSDKAEVFIDVSADGAGTFLGVLDKLYRVPMDASGNAGKPVDIWMDKPVKGPDGMRAANGKLFLAENGAGKIDIRCRCPNSVLVLAAEASALRRQDAAAIEFQPQGSRDLIALRTEHPCRLGVARPFSNCVRHFGEDRL
jgi:hypothetical protein